METFLDKLMGQIVYILCALTCLGCTVLLFGRYRKSRTDLLFWSALSFLGFTLTNILLYLDLVVFPGSDFGIFRNSVTMGGVLVLLFGLIRNST